MAYPTAPATQTTGATIFAATLNSYRDNLNGLVLARPYLSAWRNNAYSPSSGSWQQVGWQASDSTAPSGLGIGFAAGVNSSTDRISLPVAGRYRITARCGWAANGTGARLIEVRKNSAESQAGGSQAFVVTGTGNNGPYNGDIYSGTWTGQFSAGDYLNMFIRQDSGGALSTNTGSAGGPYLAVEWVSQ